MSGPKAEPLSAAEVEHLAAALRYWVERHPAPHVPFLGFAQLDAIFSPQAIASAVEHHAHGEATPESRAILRLFQFGTEMQPLGEILEGLVASVSEPDYTE